MFEYFIDVVFPFVGEFFGIISGIAQLNVAQFISFLSGGGVSFDYVNLLTGITDTFIWVDGIDLPVFGDIIESGISLLLNALFVGVPSTTPIWIGLPIAMFEGMFVYIVLKWGLSFILK